MNLHDIRKWAYLITGAVGSLIPILAASHAISSDQVTSLTGLITNLASLLAGGGALTAGVILGKQTKPGGALENLAPADQVINGLDAVISVATSADAMKKAADAEVQRATEAVTSVLGSIPVLGPLSQQIITATKGAQR